MHEIRLMAGERVTGVIDCAFCGGAGFDNTNLKAN